MLKIGKKHIKITLLSLIAILLSPMIVWGINTVVTGFKTTTVDQTIDAHNVCKNVKHTGARAAFVPTKTAAEWTAFRNNHPSDTTLNQCFVGCTTADGVSMSHGEVRTLYNEADSCVGTITANCNNGNIKSGTVEFGGGSYQFYPWYAHANNCSQPEVGCTTADGVSMNHGEHKPLYYGSTGCDLVESSYCSNGTIVHGGTQVSGGSGTQPWYAVRNSCNTTNFPGCSSPNLEINGKTWAACNVGAPTPSEVGTKFRHQDITNACPSGWKVPSADEAKSSGTTGYIDVNNEDRYTTLGTCKLGTLLNPPTSNNRREAGNLNDSRDVDWFWTTDSSYYGAGIYNRLVFERIKRYPHINCSYNGQSSHTMIKEVSDRYPYMTKIPVRCIALNN